MHVIHVARRWLHDPEARTCTAAGKPYQHPIIEATFQLTLFKKSTSFCNAQCLDLFTSSLPDKQDEKELPKALVGLIATAVYASISDWDTGSCKNADFDGDVFAEAYKTQIRCLEAIQLKSQRKYHVLMHTLFNIATGTRAKATRTGNSSAVEKALRAIDVDAMPDELD
ncbi:hypothetical protein C8Q72DRAFT_888468 [Fomitopsis betulina]|nr:hypothetical protein C8Q72DRAFT_888468 [Fomitopsis betulina]